MPFASLRTGNRRVDPVKQQSPVWQAGERIMLNQITNPLFSRFSFTVVGKGGYVVGGHPLFIPDSADGEPLQIFRSIFSAIPDFSLPISRIV